MKFQVTFSDDRTITWEGQDLETVTRLATDLANGATFTIKELTDESN